MTRAVPSAARAAWGAPRAWVRWAPVGLLVIAAAVLLPGFRFHVSTDGIAYLSIAEHWLAGRWVAAVNSYWSPLLPWLLAPLLAVGLPGLVAAKVAGVASGVVVLLAVERLLRTCGIGVAARGATLIGLVPFVLMAAYTWISPDLLVAAPLLLLVDRLLSGAWRRSGAAALGTGALGGVAYLAKLYALPVVVVVVVAAGALHLHRRGRAAWREPLTLAAGVALVVGTWAGALTAVTGTPTVGTAGSINTAFFVPGSSGSPLMRKGLFPPPHEGSVTAWEDPSALREPDGAPVAAGGGTGVVSPPQDPTLTGWLGGLLGNVGDNLGLVWQAVRRWWPAAVLVLAGGVLAAMQRRGRLAVPAAAAAVWSGGLLLLIAHERYLWAAVLLLVPLVAAVPDLVRGRARLLALAAVLVVWLPGALHELRAHEQRGPAQAALADELALLGIGAGDAVASDAFWHESVHVCHHLRCRYHGMPHRDADDAGIVGELDDHRITWFLAWTPQPPHLDEPAGVAEAGGLRVSVYRVR